MTLKGIFGYKHADSSIDYNARTSRVLERLIVDGGALSYNGTMSVTIAPFIAHSYDGLTIINDANVSLTVVDSAINYLICHARYQTTSAPLIEMQVVTETDWLNSTNKNYFITFAKFDLSAGGFASVTAAEADYSVSDYSDKIGRTSWRNVSATVAALPTIQNRDGDTRIALDDRVSYTWNSSSKTWVPTKTKAAQVTVVPYGSITATDVQAALQQIADLFISTAVASNVGVTPAGNIASTTAQAALEELDAEKAGLSLANTFTANQTISASGFDTTKFSVANTTTAGAAHWAQLAKWQNSLNNVRVNLAGSGAADAKQFQLTLNAAYNSGTAQFTADNAGASAGREAAVFRYNSTDHKLTFGFQGSTTVPWSESAFFKTDLIFPKTVNLPLTIQNRGTLASDTGVLLNDRVIYSTYATGVFRVFIPFIRKFLSAPASVNIASIVGGSEVNVTSATVVSITADGFSVDVTPTITGMTTLARDWVTA